MSLLADSSPPPKMPREQLFDNGGFNSHSFPSNFKHPKLDAVRSFPVNCGALAGVTALSDITHPKDAVNNSTVNCRTIACGSCPSNIKRPKVDVARDFPEHCGPFASGMNAGESEWSGGLENPRHSDGAKFVVAIPAVPLRSIPLVNMKRDPEKSVASDGKDDDVRKTMADDSENKVHSQEESWKRDSEKLAAVIAEAKDYINAFHVKYSTCKEFPALEDFLLESKGFCQFPSSESDVLHKRTSTGEPKPSMETVKKEKRAREIILAESVMLQNLDESLSEKRMKVEDGVSKVVQEKKTSGLESKWEDNEEEICVLSPAEWNMLQCFMHKCDGAKASIGKIEIKPEKWSSRKFIGGCSNMVESQWTDIVDFVNLCSVGMKSDQQSEGVSDCELTETKPGEKHQEYRFMDLDVYASVCKKEQDEPLEKFTTDDSNAIVMYSDIGIKAVVNGNNEPKYCDNQDLINLNIVQHEQPQGFKVMEALKLYEEHYTELVQEHKVELSGERKGTKYAHLEAAERLKAEGMCFLAEKPFGHIPGIEIGDEFRFRAELAVVGLHRQFVSGIDYVVLDGKKFATSVVDSGRYENKAKALDVLIYSGQGGNPKFADNAVDQKLEKGNLALVNSMEMGYPVRVTYKRKSLMASKSLGMSKERNFVYVYDGLYTINNFSEERDQNGKMVFKFELHRIPGQPRPPQTNAKSRKAIMCMEVCVLDDVSQGKEKLPIRAMNGVDDDRPLPFTYITNIVYPHWYQHIEPIGCNCINGCSDSQQCPCVLKNGGEIPFNENGAIIRAKPTVHECGPSCKCPPSCMNRVSQHGPRYQLEIFKTKSRGWGVRSQDYISSGSFICEYVGELLRDKEAEQRIGNDEYLFDICDSHDIGAKGFDSKPNDDGFAIDAAMFGNIGRFINHSCSPNLYAQEVLYDHYDKRMPHIMFFATKNIPPLQELSYDYNYKMGRVCDVNGNIKTKNCYCGSRKCTGRMY
ncbi:hypothetical protein Pfo_015033 [Paulownia fortunei]|nr:hypothetical protein Pfo_015033 [Paulownia fortunei]